MMCASTRRRFRCVLTFRVRRRFRVEHVEVAVCVSYTFLTVREDETTKAMCATRVYHSS